MRSSALIISFLIALPSMAKAQAEPDSVHLRNDCRLAAQILRDGQPANKREWALGFIPNCGTTATNTIAQVWRGVEASSDTALLHSLRVAAFHLQDRTLFETFLSTAGSQSSSTPARIEAWRYVFRFTNPGVFVSDAELSITPITALCDVDYFTVGRPLEISPLPSDFEQQVDQTATRVSIEPGTGRVQRFASCVHQFIEYNRKNRSH